jgi:hypothetical protein
VGTNHSRTQRPAAYAIAFAACLLPLFIRAATLPDQSAPPAAAPTAEERQAYLDRARSYALEYIQTLPDFICNETVRRYREGVEPGTWDLTDTLNVRLSYYGHREDYKLLTVNNKSVPLNTRYDSLTGSISEGEFGSLLRQIFEPDPSTEIRWSGWSTIGAVRVAVFSYRMPAAHARYAVNFMINDQRYGAVAGRRGAIYLEPDSGQILRVSSAADGLAPEFPVQKLISTLDYAATQIGDRSFLLPRTAEVQMAAGSYQSRNTIEFVSYHKFAADTDVTFTPDGAPVKKK